MVINTNAGALNASTMLARSSTQLGRSLARLSSGSKIVSPADDSAGLAVSMRTSAQLARLNAAADNVGNAISFSQTQDGYLQKVADVLTRTMELDIRAQDSTMSDADRQDADAEFQTLGETIKNIGDKNFNGVKLFDGNSLNVTVDAEGNTCTLPGVSGQDITSYIGTGYESISLIYSASHTLSHIQAALDLVAAGRATIGSNLESLGYYQDGLTTLKNNLSAANSRITDVDVAQESTNYAKANILVQSGTRCWRRRTCCRNLF